MFHAKNLLPEVAFFFISCVHLFYFFLECQGAPYFANTDKKTVQPDGHINLG